MILATLFGGMLAYWFARFRRGATTIVLGLCLAAMASATSAQEFKNGAVVRLLIDSRPAEGAVIFWDREAASVIGMDGRWHWFDPRRAKDAKQVAGSFRAYTATEFRAKLLDEFGPGYDVSGAGRHLVVHPVGQRDQWAPRFERLDRAFDHYFTVRGWRPQPSGFPLVAVVLPDRAAFDRYAAAEGSRLGQGIIGYYSPRTNRVALYDTTADRPGADWGENAATVIHEAAHQLAFNGGMHNRYAETPKWLCEGLACAFEAPGVWNAESFRQTSDRFNAYRKRAFETLLPTRPKGLMAELVQSDRLFASDPERAYAEAWAMTFFLIETRPRAYFDYLKKVAGLENFRDRPAPERLRDFVEAFGVDLATLEAKYLQHLADAK